MKTMFTSRENIQESQDSSGSEKKRKSSRDHDVVKIGFLHIKRPPSNNKLRFKAWQKKFFVLRDVSFDDGLSTIEMFENENDYQNEPTNSEYTLDLNNVTHIESYDASKRFPHAFMVIRRGQTPLVVGCMCDIEKHSWMEALSVLSDKRKLVYLYKDISLACQKDKQRRSSLPLRIHYEINPIYAPAPSYDDPRQQEVCFTPFKSSGPPPPPRHNPTLSVTGDGCTEFISKKCKGVIVNVQQTLAASKNNLVGDYYMNVLPGYVNLTSVKSLREAIRWPIQHINRFKSEDLKSGENLLILEAGLYCGQAEGSYEFKTYRGKDLVRMLKEAACKTQYIITNCSNNNSPRVPRGWRQPKPQPSPATVAGCNTDNFIPHPETMERSISSPNLFGLQIPESSSRFRNISGTIVSEFSSITESNSYLELIDDNNITSETTKQLYSEKMKITFEQQRRDSGFNDSENEELRSQHHHHHHLNNNFNNNEQHKGFDSNSTNIPSTPPPLPPKKHRDSGNKEMNQSTESIPSTTPPPPLPRRQCKK